jgi:hypothetical protein
LLKKVKLFAILPEFKTGQWDIFFVSASMLEFIGSDSGKVGKEFQHLPAVAL